MLLEIKQKIKKLLKKLLFRRLRRYLVKRKIRNSKHVYIIAGAGGINIKGWIGTDIEELNILDKKDYEYLLTGKKIDKLLLEHVIEHLYYDEFIKFLELIKPYLNKGATIRIAVPDANHPSLICKRISRN